MTRRGRTSSALEAIGAQRQARATLVAERKQEALALSQLRAERAALDAQGRQIETEAAPIVYVRNSSAGPTSSARSGC